jgi:hypothetical protein
MLAAILAIGCEDQGYTIDAVATDSLVSIEELDNGTEQPGEVRPNSDDPFQVFGLREEPDAQATISWTHVWLINTRGSLIITAAGGAATVLVDTLGAADSVLVRLETKADSVALSARTPEGVSMGSVSLPMDSEPKRAAFPR